MNKQVLRILEISSLHNPLCNFIMFLVAIHYKSKFVKLSIRKKKKMVSIGKQSIKDLISSLCKLW